MKKFVFLLPLLLAFAAGPAAAQDVSYNFDKETDFSQFRSYKWIDIKGVQQVDNLTARQIAVVIDAELAKKGLLKTDSDSADLYIGYQTALSRQTAWMAYRDGWGYGPAWGGGLDSIAESSIHAGELDLDIYAASDKKLVWRGTVSNAVDLNLHPEGTQKNIQRFSEKLLKNYPPVPPPADRRSDRHSERHSEGNDKPHPSGNHAAAHCFSCSLGTIGTFLHVLPRNHDRHN